MKTVMKRITASIAAILLPLCTFAMTNKEHFYLGANLLSLCNFILLITSIICIFQYFFLRGEDHTRLQAFNIIAIITFYWIAISFLVHHKA